MRQRTYFAVFLLWIFPALVLGQDSVKTSPFSKYALQFQIKDFLQFTGFQGSVLSLKRQLTGHSALRFGLSFSSQNSDYKSNAKSYGAQDTTSSDSKSNDKEYSIGITLPYVYYFHPEDQIKLYCGLGPSFGYSYSHQKDRTFLNEISGKNIRESKTYSTGAKALLGVEWFFYKRISLTLEYGMSFYYSYSKVTFSQYYSTGKWKQQQNESHTWKFYGNNVLFGLSVYFDGF